MFCYTYSPAHSGGVDSRRRALCFEAASLARGLTSSQFSLPPSDPESRLPNTLCQSSESRALSRAPPPGAAAAATVSESHIGVPEWDLTTWIDLTPEERPDTQVQMNTHSDSQTNTHAGRVRDSESPWETRFREERRGGEGEQCGTGTITRRPARLSTGGALVFRV